MAANDILDDLTTGKVKLEDLDAEGNPLEGEGEGAGEPEEETPETTPEETPPEEGDEEGEAAAADEEAAWIEETGKRYGMDLSKYKTREDAIAGLVATAKKVGEKDEYADFGREVARAIQGREEEARQFFQGERLPDKEPAGKEPEFADLSDEDIDQLIEDGSAENAPATAQRRLQRYQRELRRRMHQVAFKPEAYLKDRVGLDPEVTQRQLQERLAQSEAERKREDWLQRHADKLYVDGDGSKGFTPLGQLANNLYPRAGGQTEVDRMQAALEWAQDKMPKPTPRNTSQAARHRPAVGPTGQKKDIRERLTKAESPKEAQEIALQALLEDAGFAASSDED